MKIQYPARSFGLIILATACWGLGTVLLKRALDDVSPLTLNTMLLVGSVALLWILVALGRLSVRRAPGLYKAGLLGLLHPGLVLTLGTIGLDRISASLGAIIQAIQPAMIILLAWWVLHERPTGTMLLLTAVATAGVFLVIGVESTVAGGSIVGSALMLSAALIASLVLVLMSRVVVRVDPLVAVGAQQTVGLFWAVGVLLIQAAWTGGFDPGLFRLSAWGWALASGATFFALGFYLYYRGLRIIPAAVAAPFLSLIPVFALAGGILYLSERLLTEQWIGVALILFAVTAISRQRHRARGST